jgi:hypothetical protein
MDARAHHNALELEIFKEQAGALGSAGKLLSTSLKKHQEHIQNGGREGDPVTEELLDEIAQRAYELMLQREFVGFTQNNAAWLLQGFALPPGVLRKLGIEDAAPGQHR